MSCNGILNPDLFNEYVDHLHLFNPMIAHMCAEQERIYDMKHEAAVMISHRFAPVTPGRKPLWPLWAKIVEEVEMCYETLRRRCEHSTRSVTIIEVADIIDQYRRSHPDPESDWHVEPAIRHNIFREFYYRVVKDGLQVPMSGRLYKSLLKK